MIILKLIFVCMGTISTSLAARPAPNNHQNGTTSSNFLAKFHQNDYKVNFERIELIYFRKQYLKKLDVLTYKYNRTSAVVNMTWLYRVDVHDYNVVIQAYRFASNEYRMFPLRFEVNFCDAIKENVAGLQALTHCGNFTGCPFLKDVPTRIYNWSPDATRLPPFIPSGKYMLELEASFRNAELYLIRAYGTIYRPIAKK